MHGYVSVRDGLLYCDAVGGKARKEDAERLLLLSAIIVMHGEWWQNSCADMCNCIRVSVVLRPTTRLTARTPAMPR